MEMRFGRGGRIWNRMIEGEDRGSLRSEVPASGFLGRMLEFQFAYLIL
jgi:hypothetical protein